MKIKINEEELVKDEDRGLQEIRQKENGRYRKGLAR